MEGTLQYMVNEICCAHLKSSVASSVCGSLQNASYFALCSDAHKEIGVLANTKLPAVGEPITNTDLAGICWALAQQAIQILTPETRQVFQNLLWESNLAALEDAWLLYTAECAAVLIQTRRMYGARLTTFAA